MNNFDTSSSGIKIELDVYQDGDLSRINYNDWLNNESGDEPVLKLDLGGRDNYAYIVGDVSKPFYKKSHLNRMKKAELAVLVEMYSSDYVYDIDDYTKFQMVDELSQVTIEKHYEAMAEMYEYWKFQDNIPHNWYTSKGYCQGDARIIIRVDGELTPSYRKYVSHILWDSPVTLKITVDGEEYYGDEFMDDPYEYDKDEIIKKVQAHTELSDYVKEWVINKLPSYPEYQD
jgi:hypothetical protein